jgi:hypothetical protein
MITEQKIKRFEAKIALYSETNPKTGKKGYRRRYLPEIDAATREVGEWERGQKEKAERYIEINPCSKELVIRMKYIDLLD